MTPVQTTNDPDLCIVAGGRTLHPILVADDVYQFLLPSGATNVRLTSRAAAPTDARPWLEDRRRLGVYVERIVLRCDGEVRNVPVDDPALAEGWWATEGTSLTPRRWTNGDSLLPLPIMDGPMMLEIRASDGGMSYFADNDLPDPVTARPASAGDNRIAA
jgi:hypothetical protein